MVYLFQRVPQRSAGDAFFTGVERRSNLVRDEDVRDAASALGSPSSRGRVAGRVFSSAACSRWLGVADLSSSTARAAVPPAFGCRGSSLVDSPFLVAKKVNNNTSA